MDNVKPPSLTDETAVNEVARLRQVEQELSSRLHQQAAIASLSQQALLSSDLNQFLDQAAHLIAETLAVDYCKILELLPGGEELLLRAGAGWKEGYTGHVTVSAGKNSQAGFTLLSQVPVIVSNLRTETRFNGPPLLLEHNVTSGMSVIIPAKSGVFGVIGVHTRAARTFTPDDAHFLQSVANVIASVIARLKAESALRSSHDQLAIILQGVADGITAQDPSGRLIYANNAAARVLGYPTEQALLDAPLTEVMSKFQVMDEGGNPFPLDQLPGRKAIQGESNPQATIRFRILKTGEERWSVTKATAVLSPKGDPELVVNIFQDITELKRAEWTQRFLAEAGKLLSASLDYDATLTSLANLLINDLADWCVVTLVEANQSTRQVVVAHADPQKVELVRELQQRYPLSPDAPIGLPNVLRTGQTEFYPEIGEDLIKANNQDENRLKLVRELGLRSAIIAPLVARGRTLGAITLVWAESSRHYTPADVALAEELARRAAIAIDNARLYSEAQMLNTELEARVTKRTSQLQALVTKLRSEIAERKRVEDELQRNEGMLQGLFESAPDALVLVNEEGVVVRVNQQAEAMFGYSRQEMVGEPVERLLPDQFRGAHAQHRSSYLKDLSTRPMDASLDLQAIRKDGSVFPVDVMLSPVKTEEGIQVISAIRDITESKRMQAELSEMQRRLIESLESERLHLAQELHDGPIQDLYGVSYQLKSLESEPDQAFQGEDGRQRLQESEEMIQHIISLLRTVCGDLRPPALAPFGLEKAILGHIESIMEAHPELDVKLDLMPDERRLPERVRLALFRIYQHAISNVIRHAKAQTLQIRLNLDDEQAVLEIKDDGCGFTLPARWIEYARSGHLGLVGTTERVKAIGGRLNIETSPGNGTLIQVTVPINREGEILYG